jgi:hypothetical protein
MRSIELGSQRTKDAYRVYGDIRQEAPTNNATNTLYPLMPEACKTSILGLGLGLCTYYNKAYNFHDDFLNQQKEKNPSGRSTKNNPFVHFCNSLRAEATLFHFMLSESSDAFFSEATYIYLHHICLQLSSPDSCASFLFLRVVYFTPKLRY